MEMILYESKGAWKIMCEMIGTICHPEFCNTIILTHLLNKCSIAWPKSPRIVSSASWTDNIWALKATRVTTQQAQEQSRPGCLLEGLDQDFHQDLFF